MRMHASTFGPLARPTGRATLVARLALVLEILDGWLERRRQRLALQELDDHLLKDLGLTRADVVRESGKAFWQP